MKISLDDYDAICKMGRNKFTKWLTDYYKTAYHDCENDLENLSAERWLEVVNETPKVKEHFSIWDYDDLYKRLSRKFTKENVERILKILTEKKLIFCVLYVNICF